jgi:DNA-binding MarR family transcriptional regulator
MWPGASASEVSEFIAVNKAVVSKSVTVLAERRLIVLADGPRGSRPLYLTAAGAQMHHDMLPISMSGQDIILAGMTAQQTADMNAWLREMIEKVRDAALPEPVGAAAATSSAGS